MIRGLTVTWLSLALTSMALAGKSSPAFTKQPAAVREGDRVRIEFAVDRETDVAVYVLDAEGGVVRHLAAGLLGEKAPPPLTVGSLEQTLVWDGRDDAGKPVWGRSPAEASGEGGFRVRVAVGLAARYDGTAFGSEARPDDLTNAVGLGARPRGGVYVLSERWKRIWWRNTTIHAFGRDGRYEKTIKPFPASIGAEKVRTLTPFTYEGDRPLPVIYRVLAMSYYPYEDPPQHMVVGPDGTLHLLTIRSGYRLYPGDTRIGAEKFLASLAPDGAPAYADYAGPALPGQTTGGDVYLAMPSDGKAVFVTGMERGSGKDEASRPNAPAVWRIGLPERKAAEVFFGDPKTARGGKTALSDPRGLAADGKGRLYVADRGNGRVVILDERNGRFLGSFKAEVFGWVGANHRTGAVYVAGKDQVTRFLPGADGTFAEAGQVRLPPAASANYRGKERRCFALDDSGERAALWVGLHGGGEALVRCEERKDGTFSDFGRAGYRPAQMYWNLFAGQDGRTIGCKVGSSTVRILDEISGRTRDLMPTGRPGEIYRLGPNGQIYALDHGSAGGVRRWDRDGKPLPFASRRDDPNLRGRLPNRPSGTTAWERDFDVDRAGNVYVKQRGKVYHGRMCVDKYDKDGVFLGTVIWVVSDGAYGPRVDAAGNLYIAETLHPPGQEVPEFFAGRLPEVRIDQVGTPLQQYRWMYGSVVKFRPEGGAVWFPILDKEKDVYPFDGTAGLPERLPKVKVDITRGNRATMTPAGLEGALWYRFGCSYVLDMHPGHNRRCHCTATELDVDDFGRVFYTDQGRFRVVVLDTAGNEILAFGRYGNQDSCGPEIAFNWFTGLGVTDRWVYAADGGNRRLVRVKLTYALDETCEVR